MSSVDAPQEFLALNAFHYQVHSNRPPPERSNQKRWAKPSYLKFVV